MLGQKKHQRPHAEHLFKRLRHFFRLCPADALHLCKTHRILFDHAQGVVAEPVHNALSGRRPNALDHAARKIPADRAGGCGKPPLAHLHAKLRPMHAVRLIVTGKFQLFPRLDRAHGADCTDKLSSNIQIQHAKAGLFIFEDHVFHAAAYFYVFALLRHSVCPPAG